jgi:hypothetical protein
VRRSRVRRDPTFQRMSLGFLVLGSVESPDCRFVNPIIITTKVAKNCQKPLAILCSMIVQHDCGRRVSLLLQGS